MLGITSGGVMRRIEALGKGRHAEKTALLHQIVRDARKRVLRKWHPDVCKDPSAEEMTKRINNIADEMLKLCRVVPRPQVSPVTWTAQPTGSSDFGYNFGFRVWVYRSGF
jgi:hypothetical protein